ncbi:rhomboid protease [Entamoeba marina]
METPQYVNVNNPLENKQNDVVDNDIDGLDLIDDNNDETSISGERPFLSITNILFPRIPSENEQEGYVDIDGYISSFQPNTNIFLQILYCIFPCFVPPFINNTIFEKYLKCTLSISFLICLILIGVFISELCVCGIATFEDNPGFGPSANTIVNFGAKYSFAIKQEYEIYRLFSSMFLSPSLLCLILEIFFCLRFLLYFEHRYGLIIFITSYILTGEAGVLLSGVLSCNNVSVCSIGPFTGLLTMFLVELGLTDQTRKSGFKRSVFSSLVGLLLIVFVVLFPLADFSCIMGGAIMGVSLGALFFIHMNKWFSSFGVSLQTLVYFVLALFPILYFTFCCLLLLKWIEPLSIGM